MQSLLNKKKKGQIFKGNFHIKINVEFVTRSLPQGRIQFTFCYPLSNELLFL